MKSYKPLVILLWLTACSTRSTDWTTLDYGSFKIKTPPGWTKFIDKGIDSYVGGLTNGKDTLWFDYGWYSAEIDDEGAAQHLYCQDTINGILATIQIPKIDGHGSIRLSFSQLDEKNKFSLGGDNIPMTDTILKIFKSVVFKKSDTSRNKPLTLSKFKNYSFGFGNSLFKANCSGCHHPTRLGTGPALKDAFQRRTNQWVYLFLTNRNSIPPNSLMSRQKPNEFQTTCNRFPDLTQAQVDQIISYVKDK